MLRRAEVTTAVGQLAPSAELAFLGFPDGGLDEHVDALADVVGGMAEGCTHVVSPWAGDRHPDHEACATAAARVAQACRAAHWRYPIWLWHWGDPADEDPWATMRRLRLDPADREAKLRALQCHVSQHTALSPRHGDEPILSDRMLSHFRRPEEIFETALPDAAGQSYFDSLYRQSPDPWGLADRWYERRKRQILLAALPRERFARAFEPGCATGLLTERLAGRCDHVVAWDGTRAAVDQARRRLAGTNVEVARRRIPDAWPEGEFDLIVLSEVGYYCVDLTALAALVQRSLAPDGVLVACHWLHPAPDHAQHSDDVHEVLGRSLHRIVRHTEADFRLDVWTRSGQSVAAAEGIVS